MENRNTEKRRVLIFSTAYYPFVGGAEVAVKEITDRIDGEFDFDMITARLDKKLPIIERIGSINIYRIGVGIATLDKILLPFLGMLQAFVLHRKNNYFCFWAIMVTFGSGAGYLFNIFRSIFLKNQVPIVLTLQEGDSEVHLKYRWAGLISLSWKLALSRTHVLTGISTFLLKRAKENGYKKEGYLVPNGVDLTVFTKKISDEEIEKLKHNIGKNDGDIFLITDGRLTHKNATDDVISALPKLPNNISFLVIGKGEEGVNLQRKVDDLGLRDRVKFLGFISLDEIPKYQSISDIFIRPSRSEGFGNSMIQAMAFGLPVITTPVGGITDFIDDKVTGIYCSPNNPGSIAEAVNLLLNDQNLREKIIENGKVLAKEQYGWDRIANRMKEVFNVLS